MSETTTIQVKRRVREELDRLRRELDFASLSETIEFLLADRKHESDVAQLFQRMDQVEKQIALLLEQQGGADEDDQISE